MWPNISNNRYSLSTQSSLHSQQLHYSLRKAESRVSGMGPESYMEMIVFVERCNFDQIQLNSPKIMSFLMPHSSCWWRWTFSFCAILISIKCELVALWGIPYYDISIIRCVLKFRVINVFPSKICSWVRSGAINIFKKNWLFRTHFFLIFWIKMIKAEKSSEF
jgi:hypothetical protein